MCIQYFIASDFLWLQTYTILLSMSVDDVYLQPVRIIDVSFDLWDGFVRESLEPCMFNFEVFCYSCSALTPTVYVLDGGLFCCHSNLHSRI